MAAIAIGSPSPPSPPSPPPSTPDSENTGPTAVTNVPLDRPKKDSISLILAPNESKNAIVVSLGDIK